VTRADLIRNGPYRLLFPLGVLCGILGVGHWLFWSLGWLPESHSFFHATIQVQGFLSCFVVGFLMTALPRFLGAPPARWAEVGCAVGAVIVFVSCSLLARAVLAQAAFLFLVASTVVFALRRLPRRTKSPPASFILIGFGLAQAVAGSALMIGSGMGQKSLIWMEAGRQMLQVGFLLCLVLGIAGYLAPFLTGYAGDPSCDPGVTPLRGINPVSVLFHSAAGALIATSFLYEAHRPAWATGVRAIVALMHLAIFGRIYRPLRKKTTYAFFFWIACWMVLAGLWAVYLWPDYRLAGLHLMFIGGFSLMIFSFGLMVILSHGAEAQLLMGPLLPLKIVGTAVLLAAAFRYAADVDGWRYKTWIHAASGTWVLAALLWLGYIFPKLWRIPLEEPGYGRSI
jgi:uncharacterized protein involved in response to NO